MTEEDPTRCPECGGPYLWGGMSWYTGQHTPEHHARRHRALLRAACLVFRRRITAASGHRVTIRFAGKYAWFECSCGQVGSFFLGDDVAYAAIVQGKQHLDNIGRQETECLEPG